MSREDLEKLLGGYATGTLMPEERQALFDAALDDQELFNALAREQSLRDLLRDPAARVQLMAALDDAPARRWEAVWARLRRPVAVAVAMAGVGAIGVFLARRNVQAPQPVTMAQMRPPAPMPAAGAQADAGSMPAPVREARRVPASEAPAESHTAPEAVGEAQPVMARKMKAERPEPAAGAPAEPQIAPAAVQEGLSAKEKEVNPEGQAPATEAQAHSQTKAAPVLEARAAKANEVKTGKPAPPAGAPAGAGGARAQFGAALDRAETAGAVPPPASNQAAPPKPQGAVAASSGLVRPAPPVSPASEVQPGVPYSVLRKLPGGEFAEADPNQELPAGAALKLRFVPRDDGYLYVLESGPHGSRQTVATGRVERLKPWETPELKPGAPGEKEYYVLFTRRPQAAAGLGGAGFTIKLKYK